MPPGCVTANTMELLRRHHFVFAGARDHFVSWMLTISHRDTSARLVMEKWCLCATEAVDLTYRFLEWHFSREECVILEYYRWWKLSNLFMAVLNQMSWKDWMPAYQLISVFSILFSFHVFFQNNFCCPPYPQ